MRYQVLMEQPLCVGCLKHGRTTEAAQVDHIIPLQAGGTDEFSNLQGLCLECHRDKTAKDMGYRIVPETGLDGWPQNNFR